MKQKQNKNQAATHIQKAIRRFRPVNAITYKGIKDPWHVMWFKDPEHRHYSTYTVNTFKQLKTHPETRAKKTHRNIMLRRTPGTSKTPKPNISSPQNENIIKNIKKKYTLIQNRIQKQNEDFLAYIWNRVNGSNERYNKIINKLRRTVPHNL